jgi:hypothetical protein
MECASARACWRAWEPGFFSKEVCEDLLPFFHVFLDEDDYCVLVVGCGLIEGKQHVRPLLLCTLSWTKDELEAH